MKLKITTILTVAALAGCASIENTYQHDMDKIRIEHIDLMSNGIGVFFEKSGHLPLEDQYTDTPIEVFITHRKIPKAMIDQAENAGLEIHPLEELENAFTKVFEEEVTFYDDPQRVATFAHEKAKPVGNAYYKYERCLRLASGAEAKEAQ